MKDTNTHRASSAWLGRLLSFIVLAGLYKLGAAKRKNGPVECGWNGLSVCMS